MRVPRHRPAPSAGSDRGAAAVEFALVSVLLLTLAFGIIQYGFYFREEQAAATSAREAARLAAVGVNDCGAFQQAVVALAKNAGITIQNEDVQTAVQQGASGDQVVQATVEWQPTRFGFPFVPFLPNGTLKADGTSHLEDAANKSSCR